MLEQERDVAQMVKHFFSLQVNLKQRDGSGFPTIVAADGSPDIGIDAVFADVVKAACDDGSRRNSNNNNNNNIEAACRKMRFGLANGDYIVSSYKNNNFILIF